MSILACLTDGYHLVLLGLSKQVLDSLVIAQIVINQRQVLLFLRYRVSQERIEALEWLANELTINQIELVMLKLNRLVVLF